MSWVYGRKSGSGESSTMRQWRGVRGVFAYTSGWQASGRMSRAWAIIQTRHTFFDSLKLFSFRFLFVAGGSSINLRPQQRKQENEKFMAMSRETRRHQPASRGATAMLSYKKVSSLHCSINYVNSPFCCVNIILKLGGFIRNIYTKLSFTALPPVCQSQPKGNR